MGFVSMSAMVVLSVFVMTVTLDLHAKLEMIHVLPVHVVMELLALQREPAQRIINVDVFQGLLGGSVP